MDVSQLPGYQRFRCAHRTVEGRENRCAPGNPASSLSVSSNARWKTGKAGQTPWRVEENLVIVARDHGATAKL